ncbi:MAG: site-specific integrase [Actinobacteria bacterium]|nr:site-specific integrase [Actinomycetota bacterium]
MAIRERQIKGGRKAYDVILRRPNGSQYSRSFRSKREAVRFEAQENADRSRADWRDPALGAVRFEDYAEQWLLCRPGLRPRTVELYRSELKCHLLPAFGAKALSQISPQEVRAWYAGLATRRSQVTAAKCYRLLTAIFNTAVTDGVVANSPCRIRGASVEKSPERRLPTVEQAVAIATSIDPRYRGIVLLAAFCGLRLGELQGLTRADVDLARRRISVTKQRQEVSRAGIIVSEPKSRAGVRQVTIPESIVPALAEHLETWSGPGPDGSLFAGERGGLRRASFYRAWRAALRAVGLPSTVHLHDLRHVANTLAARVPGTTTKDLMARMGHASPDAALRYLHASPEADAAIADGIDAEIRRRNPGLDIGGPGR